MMNKRLVFLAITLLAMLVLVSGCRKSVPTDSYSGNAPTEKYSAEKIKNSIIRAGASLGWVIVPAAKNQLEGTLNVRAHTLVVTIDYSAAGYKIQYKSSVNMEYKNGKIHPQYRNWVLNLQRHIDTEIATISAR